MYHLPMAYIKVNPNKKKEFPESSRSYCEDFLVILSFCLFGKSLRSKQPSKIGDGKGVTEVLSAY